MSPALLQARGVGVRFGAVTALRDVSFCVQPGDSVAVVGRNGAGKSTLLRVMAGLQAFSGTVVLHGRDRHHRRAEVDVAYVPQRSGARWDLPVTVLDAVLAGRWGRRGGHRYGPADRADALDALDRLGVAHLARRPVGELSGGQAQRVLLARALAQRPDVLLLDEPFAGLDAASTLVLAAELAGLAEVPVAVVCALHELGVARRVFRRTIALDVEILADGPTATVLDTAGLERVLVGTTGAGS